MAYLTPSKFPTSLHDQNPDAMFRKCRDQRSIANRLGAAGSHHFDNESNKPQNTLEDPMEPARSHGNEPSRGAKIDAELKAEEEDLLKKKGKI